MAVDGAGNLFIADCGNDRVRKVSPDGIITTVAGNGTQGFSGDGGPATSAQLADRPAWRWTARATCSSRIRQRRVRKVSPDGIITTVAGNGTCVAFSGDGGPATSARLCAPTGVAVDGAGNLFIADVGNHRVRKVSPERDHHHGGGQCGMPVSGLFIAVIGGSAATSAHTDQAPSGGLRGDDPARATYYASADGGGQPAITSDLSTLSASCGRRTSPC